MRRTSWKTGRFLRIIVGDRTQSTTENPGIPPRQIVHFASLKLK